MELMTFVGLDSSARFATMDTMTDSELNTLAMAAERAADHARYSIGDTVAAARMGLVSTQTRGQLRRRMSAPRPAKVNTGCVAKENGRWVAW